MSVVTLLLFGSTSWLGCDDPLLLDEDELLWEPELCCELPAPPGVSRIVLDGGAGGVEPEPDEAPPPAWHGCTATVSVCAFFGTTITFEPGGGLVVPVVAARAWSQVGMTIVRSPRWRGITTWRTPGVCSAVETGSPDELLEELLLPPHALSPRASAAATVAAPDTRTARFPGPGMNSPPPGVGPAAPACAQPLGTPAPFG
jgi:hypothetical protein